MSTGPRPPRPRLSPVRRPRILGETTSARVGCAGDGVTEPQGHGVDQHEGDAGARIAAIGPGMVGAALNHHVAGLQIHRRIVHVHLYLALDDDDVIDGLGAVHPRGVRMIVHGWGPLIVGLSLGPALDALGWRACPALM